MGKRIPLLNQIEIDLSTGCWNWKGAHTDKGYGIVRYNGKNILVSRLIAHIFLGMLLGGVECALHQCDNPKCFNPFHLFVGTKADNNRDMVSKKRDRYSGRSSCKHGHLFSLDNTIIRRGSRVCLTCQTSRNRSRVIEFAIKGLSSKGTPFVKGPYKNSPILKIAGVS